MLFKNKIIKLFLMLILAFVAGKFSAGAQGLEAINIDGKSPEEVLDILREVSPDVVDYSGIIVTDEIKEEFGGMSGLRESISEGDVSRLEDFNEIVMMDSKENIERYLNNLGYTLSRELTDEDVTRLIEASDLDLGVAEVNGVEVSIEEAILNPDVVTDAISSGGTTGGDSGGTSGGTDGGTSVDEEGVYIPMEPIPGTQEAFQADFPSYVDALYKFLIWTSGIAAFFMINVGGFMYFTAAGNASRAEKAKGIISDALLGLVAVMTAYLILYIINPNLVTIDLTLPE